MEQRKRRPDPTGREELRNLLLGMGSGKTGKNPGSDFHFRQIALSLASRIDRREARLKEGDELLGHGAVLRGQV